MPQLPTQIMDRQALVEDLRIQIEANILSQQATFLERLDHSLHGTGQKAEAPDPQLALLCSIRDRIGMTEPKTTKTQFVWNAILQTIALVIGILFGVFSILSYSISQTSFTQSLIANKLALLALCLSSPNAVSIGRRARTSAAQSLILMDRAQRRIHAMLFSSKHPHRLLPWLQRRSACHRPNQLPLRNPLLHQTGNLA